MTSAMHFDQEAAKRVEATYTTPDVSATRVAVFRALEPRPGSRSSTSVAGRALWLANWHSPSVTVVAFTRWTSANRCWSWLANAVLVYHRSKLLWGI